MSPTVRDGAVPLIEQIYAGIDLPRDAWLETIRDACLATFDDCGEGAAAMAVTLRPDPMIDVTAWAPDAKLVGLIGATLQMTGATTDVEPRQMLQQLLHLAPPEVIRSVYLSGPVVNVHAAMRRSGHPEMHELMRSLGVPDWAGAIGIDPSGEGVVLAWCRPRTSALPRPVRHAVSRVAAHLAAASRLRRSDRPVHQLSDGPGLEAVLDASGRIAHAEGAARDETAREALREAARAIDRARTTRTEGLERLELWRALVDGRWSLVETFDSDGRRYFVARRNNPLTRPNEALDAREQQVVALTALGHPMKVVAYDLGLSESAVSLVLKRALRKLGVRTRSGLIEVHGAIIGAAEPPDGRHEA